MIFLVILHYSCQDSGEISHKILHGLERQCLNILGKFVNWIHEIVLAKFL